MPVGYLVTITLVAWCTLLALAPLRRPRTLGLMSWIFSFLLNELPFIACLWVLASTLLALGQDDLGSPGGRAALGLAILTTAGLVIIAWRGVRTGPSVEQALTRGLGEGWRSAIDPRMASQLRRRLPWGRIILGPFLLRRCDVELVANIRYGDAGKRNLLDVYRHRSHPSGGPVLVYLHGGGFRRGRKSREARPLLYRLASQGWVCISANYRLAPSASFSDQVIDVKKVIAWVGEHGHDYGADRACVFVAGSSAGGHLASMAALTPNDSAFQPGFEFADTEVVAAISLYGYYGPVDRAQRPSSPSAYVRPDAPPFFVAHGDQDTFVPVVGARRFVERLQRGSSDAVVYVELPGGQHTFDLFHSIRFETLIDAIEAFAAWVRSTPDGRSHERMRESAAPRGAGQGSRDVDHAPRES